MKTRYTTIIIDDEERARRTLKLLINKYCPNIEVLGAFENVPDGVLGINQLQPDIVFLDIEMPKYNGFELLKFFQEINFEIIFVTAYNQYALKAFEVSAVDYLLKPIDIKLFQKAVQKAINQVENQEVREHLMTLKQNTSKDFFSRIALPVSDGLLFIEADDIIYLTANGAYTTVYLQDNTSILVSKPLSYFEEILNTRNNFYRCHRSHLINIHFTKKLNRTESIVEMDNGHKIPISRNKKSDFEQFLKGQNR